MEQLNQSALALIASLIALAVSIYLWATLGVGPTSGDDDQPVTMSGGSILVNGGRWIIKAKKATYKSAKELESVEFVCAALDPLISYPVLGDFHIFITYTSPTDASDTDTIDIEYKNKKIVVTEKDEKQGKPVDDPFLNFFLNHGEHPHGDWHATKITSSGALALPACAVSPETFFLRFNFKP